MSLYSARSLSCCFCLLLAVGLLLPSCGGDSPSGSVLQPAAQQTPQGRAELRALKLLPSLTELKPGAGPARAASAESASLAGDGYESAGEEVISLGGSALFVPAENDIALAIYRFGVASEEYLDKLTLFTSGKPADAQVWVGLSNYQTGRWVFYSSSDDAAEFTLGNAAGVYSNGADFYVAVIAFDGDIFELSSLRLDFGQPEFTGWQHTWGSVESEVPRAIALDAAGNTYVVGTYEGGDGAGHDPIALLKYSPSGALLLARTFDLAASDSTFNAPGSNGNHILLDSQANIYISGSLSYWPDDSGLNHNDGLLLKLDSGFNVLWAARLRRDSSDGLDTMAFDKDGNILVAGTSSPATGSSDFTSIIFKVTPGGVLMSQKALSGGLRGTINMLSVDAETGDACIAGRFGSFFDATPYFARIAADGSLLYSKYWSGVSGADCIGHAGAGETGSLVCCTEPGASIAGGPEDDAVFIGLDTAGELVAAAIYSVPGARITPSAAKIEDGVFRIMAEYYEPEAGRVGKIFLEPDPLNPQVLGGSLFRAEQTFAEDWAFSGSAWAFTDSALIDTDGTIPFKVSLPAGFFADLTESITLMDAGNTLADWDANWTGETEFTITDTAGVPDADPIEGFEYVTTYYPEAE